MALTTLSTLFAGIESHFKPALNKPEIVSLNNIDCIYVINLDERPEKFQQTYEQLNAWGIQPYRFSAVNGWELSIEDLNELGVEYQPWMKKNLWGTFYSAENNAQPSHEIMSVKGKTYFCHCMSRGAIGICLSHLSVLQDAYDSGYKCIWVMEDDIQIADGQDPKEVCDLIEDLNALVGVTGWDILFTDPDTKGQDGKYVTCYSCALRPNIRADDPGKFARRRHLNNTFTQIGARYGAYSMIVNRSGMKKILDFFKTNKIFLPYDMDFIYPRGIRLFSLRRDVVSTIPTALSDNAAPKYNQTSND